MPLPILNTPKIIRDEDLVRFYHRTERLWTEQIAEAKELDSGTAFLNSQRAAVFNANRMLDATVPAGATAKDVVDDVDRHFASAGSRCAAWVMNPSKPPAETQPLVDHLQSSEYRTETAAILHLPRATFSQAHSGAMLRFIPARASFRHAQLLAEEATNGIYGMADAWVAHLDDPHWDSILAMQGTTAVGTAGVFIAGEVGRIDQVFVSERFRRQGIGTQLVGRVLQTCARSLLKHVLLGVEENNSSALSLYRKFGFVRVGSIISYQAPWTKSNNHSIAGG